MANISSVAIASALTVLIVTAYAMSSLFHFGRENPATLIDTREPSITAGCTAVPDMSYTGWPFTTASEQTGSCAAENERSVIYPAGIGMNILVASGLALITYVTITILRRPRT